MVAEPTRHGEQASCAHEQQIEVLNGAPEHFRASPQVGVQRRTTWARLSAHLSRATTGTAKDAAGAWSRALYRDGVRRKHAIVCVYALVVDVDEGGDIDLVAGALAPYVAVVHETFSSTPTTPRYRVVIRDHFGRHRSDDVVRAHRVLLANSLARSVSEPTDGHHAERWFAATEATEATEGGDPGSLRSHRSPLAGPDPEALSTWLDEEGIPTAKGTGYQ
jgi:hypothetical protein